jgi:hypothetical protein
MRAKILLALAVFLVLVTPERAIAQEKPPSPSTLPSRQANYSWDKIGPQGQERPVLRASFSYRDALDDRIRTKLGQGPTQVIVMRAYVFVEGNDTPIALTGKTCHVAFDPWDEVYSVRVTEPNRTQNLAVVNIEGVVRNCFEAQGLLVADKSLLQLGKPHFLGVIVEVNPISAQMLEQLRRWVSRPMGSTASGPTDAIFGSFAGIFLKQLGSSDKTITFRTQAITP